VVIGGLLCSSIFTLFVVPALFTLVYVMRERTLEHVYRLKEATE